MLIRNRSYQGQPGFHVVTPLKLADGRALLVNRGWIPLTEDGSTPTPPAPPSGQVVVTGRAHESQRRGAFFGPATRRKARCASSTGSTCPGSASRRRTR